MIKNHLLTVGKSLNDRGCNTRIYKEQHTHALISMQYESLP